MATELERRFTDRLLLTCELSRELSPPYYPTEFEPMLRTCIQKGGGNFVPEAKRLLEKEDPQIGFKQLARRGEGGLRITMEAIMLEPEFAPLFSAQDQELARGRLWMARNGMLK